MCSTAYQVSTALRPVTRITVTPELQMSLELLALPAVELGPVLTRWVEENPFLEMRDWTGNAVPRDGEGDAGAALAIVPSDKQQRAPRKVGTALVREAKAAREPDDGAESPASDSFVNLPAPWPTSLYEYLHWQLGLEALPPELQGPARVLIDALEPTGFLRENLESIAARHGIHPDQLEKALKVVQRLDPPGVGARDARESLLLQLRALREEGDAGASAEEVEIAERLLTNHSHMIESGRSTLRQLAAKLKVPVGQVTAALDLLRSLKPFPAAGLIPAPVPVVFPDFTARRMRETTLTIVLNREIIPAVRCTEKYARHVLSRLTDPQEREVAVHWLMQARRIERAMVRRNVTLERLGEALLELQAGFFRYGPQALRPLTLEDVAVRLGFHKSTVSRAVRGKYVETPHGVFPLTVLFSARLPAAGGGQGASAEAVKQRIRALVATERPESPLTDAAIQQLLRNEGIQVSRRTVAKYRAELGIPAHYRRAGRAARRHKE